MNTPLITVALREEHDVVVARQRCLQIARLLEFDAQDQVRIATAVSEVARNVINYAGSGHVAFAVDGNPPAALAVEVADQGPGIADLELVLSGSYHSPTGLGVGITGARRLMDSFEIESRPGRGTRVSLRKNLPPTVSFDAARRAHVAEILARGRPAGPLTEVRLQNQELMRAMEELRGRQSELARLNRELEDTNRGVLALYAELDEKAEYLRRADQMKSRFLSHMSHEFRTPLNSILAISRLLAERTDGDLTAEQEKQVAFVRKAAQELTEMVNDLLDLAKVEAGKTELRVAEFEVAKMLGALRGMMRPLVSTEAVRLVVEDPPPEASSMSGDEAKVSQILRNFVSNALKFTEWGEVRLTVQVPPDDDRLIVFTVSDTGIGIAPEDQDRIFQEFAQIENPVQRRVKGTGLGLALARRLAELMGGRITLESEPGRGSTFALTLPRVPPAAAPAVGAPAEAVAGPPAAEVAAAPAASILVIDDDAAARYAIARLLASLALRVVEASDGASGLRRVRGDRPSAIVLDLVMPDLGGLDVLESLRRDASTRSLPVVVVTSKALTDEERARLAEWGVPVFPKSALGRREASLELREALRRAGLTLPAAARSAGPAEPGR